MKKILAIFLALVCAFSLGACGNRGPVEEKKSEDTSSLEVGQETSEKKDQVRTIVDGSGRKVELPEKVDRAVCVGVGGLRYASYVGAADRMVGVEDYEKEKSLSRLYNFVNYDSFKDLPAIGTNGEPFVEEMIKAKPQVIILSAFAKQDPDDLAKKTNIPVVQVPGSDTTLDEKAFETIRILGQVFGQEKRAGELTEYLKGIQKDLDQRTESIPEEKKPSCYVGGVSFKGQHGFGGTEAKYGPFELIHAKNLANQSKEEGAFTIDVEQVLTWDPDFIFLDFNGMDLITKDVESQPDFYQAFTAVKEGRVFSQISFRSYASNLETALADAYFGGKMMFPEEFKDIDVEEKTGEIFTQLLGSNPYPNLKEAGYEFRPIPLGK